MSSLQIRRYDPGDYERVVELHVLGLEQTGTHVDPSAHGRDLVSPEALAATYLGDRGDFLVGELDGVIVAMGALRPFDDTRVEMKRVRVDPAYQRRGFGEEIVAHLEQRAREVGARAVHLDTTTGQKPAIAMYEKLGYEEIGRASLRLFDIVLMEKAISSSP